MIQLHFKSILELTKAFPNEQSCVDHLTMLRWNGTIVSPFDPASKVYTCKGNKYRCKNTGKYFNVRTGTMFEGTKLELRTWFVGIYLIVCHKKGISSVQLSKDLGITQKAAWFMLQRIRTCFGLEEVKPLLCDNVQLDETFVGGKNKNRHWDKKVPKCQGRSYKDKTPVMGMLSEGMVLAQVVPDTKARSIQPIIRRHVERGRTIISDEWSAYHGLSCYYKHHVVDHRAKQYVNEDGHTTNALEGFWGIVKRGILGIYHFTSRKHLQKYVDEFVFRYNTINLTTAGRFNLLLANTHSRLTYKTLIHG